MKPTCILNQNHPITHSSKPNHTSGFYSCSLVLSYLIFWICTTRYPLTLFLHSIVFDLYGTLITNTFSHLLAAHNVQTKRTTYIWITKYPGTLQTAAKTEVSWNFNILTWLSIHIHVVNICFFYKYTKIFILVNINKCSNKLEDCKYLFCGDAMYMQNNTNEDHLNYNTNYESLNKFMFSNKMAWPPGIIVFTWKIHCLWCNAM